MSAVHTRFAHVDLRDSQREETKKNGDDVEMEMEGGRRMKGGRWGGRREAGT
jgi:hypothetical protein